MTLRRCYIESTAVLGAPGTVLHPFPEKATSVVGEDALPRKAASVTGCPAKTSRRCWNRLEEGLQPLPAKLHPLAVVLQPH